jgi:hypothetical protein
LYALALPGSKFIVVPDATHETLTYFFADLVPPVLTWLSGNVGQGNSVDSLGTMAEFDLHSRLNQYPSYQVVVDEEVH